MTNVPPIQEFSLSKDDRTFKFTFELEGEERMIVTAEEENSKNDSCIYKKVMMLEDVPQKKGIVIKEMDAILESISSSFAENKVEMDFVGKSIKLSYFFYYQKTEIIIPVSYKPQVIESQFQQISSGLLKNTKILNQYFKRIGSLEEKITITQDSKTRRNNKENFLKQLFHEQKKEILTELKTCLETAIKQQNEPGSSIQNVLLQQKENSKKIDAIFNEQMSFSKKNIEQQNQQFKNINDKLMEEVSSIKNILAEAITEQNQQTKNINDKLVALAEKIIEEQKKIYTKIGNLFKEQETKLKSNAPAQGIQEVVKKLNKIIDYKNNKIKSLFLERLEVNRSIKDQHKSWINSICLLKDKRLVSCSSDKSIIIYDEKCPIRIENAHEKGVISLCVLKTGELVSSSFDNTIKIWRISGPGSSKIIRFLLLQTLKGHNDAVHKVIELNDGKLCSCSLDKKIKLWEKRESWECVKTLEGHKEGVTSVLELGDYLTSASANAEDGFRIWKKSTYECTKIIKNVKCSSWNGLSKINSNVALLGAKNIFFIVDIGTYKVKTIEDNKLGFVNCFNVLANDKVLFGNGNGEVCCFDTSFEQIIIKTKFHSEGILCLIKTDDNKFISCSADKTVNIYN